MAPPRSEIQASAERRHCAPTPLEILGPERVGRGDQMQTTEEEGTELVDAADTRVRGHTASGDYYAAEMIHFGAQDGLLDVVASQLDAGVDPNLATEGGWTPLHYASYSGRVAVVEFLLARGATPECRSLSNRTPLMVARLGNRDEVATALADAVCRTARSNPRWVRSWEAKSCMRCATPFSLFAPKHHCRRCGCTVCGSCSSGTLVLDKWLAPIKPHELRSTVSETPQRVCDGCLKYYAQELPASGNQDSDEATADDPRILARDDLQLLRAVTLQNPSLVGWASVTAADDTQLLEVLPAPHQYGCTDWDCDIGCGFGRLYQVVSDARVRADCDMNSKLVGVLRRGEVFTSLETRITDCGKTRVSVPLTSPSVHTDPNAKGQLLPGELSCEYVRAHSAYNAVDTLTHSLVVGDILVVRLNNRRFSWCSSLTIALPRQVTDNMRNGWSAGFKLAESARATLQFPVSHTKPVKLQLPTPETDSEAEEEHEEHRLI